MGKSKIRGKDLKSINIVTDRAIALALEIASRKLKYLNKKGKLEVLAQISDQPELYLDNPKYDRLALELMPKPELKSKSELSSELKSKIIIFYKISKFIKYIFFFYF